jgi:glycosyltransferase involved in cell wall biosynthesis
MAILAEGWRSRELSHFAMRILMLGKGWFPAQLGGLDRYYRALLERLPEAHGVVIGPATDPGPRVTLAANHSAPLATRLASFAGAAWHEGATADAVDAHFALYAFLPLLGPLRHKPLMVHFQGPWAEETVSAGDRSRLRRLARHRLERTVYRRAQVAVTLTGAFRRLLVESYGVSPWKTVVLAPGVDLEYFCPRDRVVARTRFALPPNAFVACAVRRLAPRMGLDVLLEAWVRVVTKNPGAKLLIAGDGALRNELEDQIAIQSLADSVTLLGRISDEDLVTLYSAADVNVVPSVSLEGFGLVVLEAGACGTPSLVTRIGGLPEAVAELGAGLMVPQGNPEALGERLIAAMQGDLPAREQTRKWAENHGWERAAAQHRALFTQMTEVNRPTRKLRVIYLDHTAQLSGAELALARLLPELREVDPHVILAEDGPLVDLLTQEGISVEVLPLARRTRHLHRHQIRVRHLPLRAILDTLVYTARLAIRLRKLSPDIVHTNSLKAGLYGAIAARLAGIPLVWHARDRIEVDYLPRLAVGLVRTIVSHLPDVVISNSAATLRTIRPRQQSMVVWSVVPDTVRARNQSKERHTTCNRFGIVGRLAPWKGQDLFLRAFAKAFPDGPQRASVVGGALFGDAEVAYEQDLHTLATELGIRERVEFHGHLEDVSAQLSQMDVLVHASTIPEPFGQVVIEGMSAGLPVVAARAGGPEEIITDGVDGLLYPMGDVETLAGILRKLCEDEALRARLGHGARQRVTEFSPEKTAARVMSAYDLARKARAQYFR